MRLGVGIAAIAGIAACGLISSLVHAKMLKHVDNAIPKNPRSQAWAGISRVKLRSNSLAIAPRATLQRRQSTPYD